MLTRKEVRPVRPVLLFVSPHARQTIAAVTRNNGSKEPRIARMGPQGSQLGTKEPTKPAMAMRVMQIEACQIDR